jgi:hypothetical protein
MKTLMERLFLVSSQNNLHLEIFIEIKLNNLFILLYFILLLIFYKPNLLKELLLNFMIKDVFIKKLNSEINKLKNLKLKF